MKYNVMLEFKKAVFNVEAKSKQDACVNALRKVISEPKVECERLFQEMLQAGMNQTYVEEIR